LGGMIGGAAAPQH